MPFPTWVNRGASSHLSVRFEDNAGKKLWLHSMSEIHSRAKQAMTNLRIEDALIM